MMNNNTIIGIIAVVAVLAIGGFFLMNNQTETAMETDNSVNSQMAMDSDPMNGEEVMSDEQTIVEIALGNPDFSTLVAAATEADLVQTLSSDGPFTVFAPTNAAFEALGEETLNAVLADKELLTSILTYHVVEGNVMAADVVALETATTVQGSTVDITVDGDTVMINDATILMTDIQASNGVIHVIDTVLIPE